ncbi:MAG: hypothetical protein M1343_09420 [Chloroflexi bacterium]|nr:hypothetical protein [Chloroflexota bacterium]MDA8187369.1 hypothetical protein [Dehalococcoidales bacterium]
MDDARDRLAAAVAAIPLIMPYATSQSLGLSMLIAWPRLAQRRRFLAALAVYALQFLILLRHRWDFAQTWLLPFALALTISLLTSFRQRPRDQAAGPT